MCGIFGSININKVDEESFKKRLDSIKHRGPDDSGIWINEEETVVLGSRRLAVQDLSVNGHMPMSTTDNKFTIVFNGEIYNNPELRTKLEHLGFIFRSNSDTESVLYAYAYWGINCFEHIKGMFAFGIYDSEKNQVVLARDRVGEKPLYYWNSDHGIEFGSELKLLLLNPRLQRKLNPIALYQYLQNGYSSGQESFIVGVNKLLPGNFLIYNINDGVVKIEKYWEVPLQNSISSCKPEDLVMELDSLLSKAVKKQLISDVPVGVLLSGGLDSSIVTAYAAQHNSEKIQTFNISFNGFGKYDESKYAKLVSEYFDTDHIELSGNELKFEMIDDLLNFYDEPLADSSMLPTFLVSSLTKKYVTVALGGDGGDELFGGYTSYSQLLKNKRTKRYLPNFAWNFIGSSAQYLPVGIRGRNYLMSLRGSLYDSFTSNKFFDEKTLWQLLNNEYKNVLSTQLINKFKGNTEETGDLIYDCTKHDLEHYLPDDILTKVDRASMASSLELRAPWLDIDVIEFAFSKVPSKLKTTIDGTKILTKLLAKEKLPSNLDIDRKQGFSIPLNDWIKDKWYEHFENEISDLDDRLFNKEFAMRILSDTKKGYTNSNRLFALVILNKWMKKYEIVL